MLKNHPKGLLVAFFSNMGERFGFYTMMAILVLFCRPSSDFLLKKPVESTAGSISAFMPLHLLEVYLLMLPGSIN